jgi:acyl-CoA reductase-like NAD-dependent aldehyde dehydrogenase
MSLPLKISDSLYISGEWVKGTGTPEPVINPATEDVIGLAPVGGRAEVDAAIAAAREAFRRGPWPRLSAAERAAQVGKFLANITSRRSHILQLLHDEGGIILKDVPLHFEGSMRILNRAVESSGRARDITLPIGTVPNPAGGRNFVGGIVRREPVGVVAAITPYNAPYFLNMTKLVPALLTGNCVVLKPSPYTPFMALLLAEVAHQTGLPKGVLNVVTGGKEVGELMTTDPRVDMITFTGSDAVAATIMAQAATTLKRLHFELGGKSAHIVRADAHLDGAIAAGMYYLANCGQGCLLPTRHLVHNSIRSAYVDKLAAAHQALKIGLPRDPATTLGPLIREVARARSEFYVEQGMKSGAKLVTGGRRPAGFNKGYFFEPTIFDNVDNRSRLAQEEIFGPIVSVIGFDSDEEAVEIANDSVYGLSGSIWSRDLGVAFEMASAIRTGQVAINGGGATADAPIAPFGGFKRSGFGREFGEEGLNAYTELKSIGVRQV